MCAALPPDVRKGSAFPSESPFDLREAMPRKMRPSLLEELKETGAGKPEAFRTSGGEAARTTPESHRAPTILPSNQSEALEPLAEELSVLSPFERFAFRVTHPMTRRAWKPSLTSFQNVSVSISFRISPYTSLP